MYWLLKNVNKTTEFIINVVPPEVVVYYKY